MVGRWMPKPDFTILERERESFTTRDRTGQVPFAHALIPEPAPACFSSIHWSHSVFCDKRLSSWCRQWVSSTQTPWSSHLDDENDATPKSEDQGNSTSSSLVETWPRIPNPERCPMSHYAELNNKETGWSSCSCRHNSAAQKQLLIKGTITGNHATFTRKNLPLLSYHDQILIIYVQYRAGWHSNHNLLFASLFLISDQSNSSLAR